MQARIVSADRAEGQIGRRRGRGRKRREGSKGGEERRRLGTLGCGSGWEFQSKMEYTGREVDCLEREKREDKIVGVKTCKSKII